MTQRAGGSIRITPLILKLTPIASIVVKAEHRVAHLPPSGNPITNYRLPSKLKM
jgi:hypothetical protein